MVIHSTWSGSCFTFLAYSRFIAAATAFSTSATTPASASGTTGRRHCCRLRDVGGAAEAGGAGFGFAGGGGASDAALTSLRTCGGTKTFS